jgi:hypothetical protein
MRTRKLLVAIAGLAVTLAALTTLFIRGAVKNTSRQLPAPAPVPSAARNVLHVLPEGMTLVDWLERCGPPDSVTSTDSQTPRPLWPVRILRYKRQRIRAVFIPDKPVSRVDKLPPYGEWPLLGCFEDWPESDAKDFTSAANEKPENKQFPCEPMPLIEVAERMQQQIQRSTERPKSPGILWDRAKPDRGD